MIPDNMRVWPTANIPVELVNTTPYLIVQSAISMPTGMSTAIAAHVMLTTLNTIIEINVTSSADAQVLGRTGAIAIATALKPEWRNTFIETIGAALRSRFEDEGGMLSNNGSQPPVLSQMDPALSTHLTDQTNIMRKLMEQQKEDMLTQREALRQALLENTRSREEAKVEIERHQEIARTKADKDLRQATQERAEYLKKSEDERAEATRLIEAQGVKHREELKAMREEQQANQSEHVNSLKHGESKLGDHNIETRQKYTGIKFCKRAAKLTGDTQSLSNAVDHIYTGSEELMNAYKAFDVQQLNTIRTRLKDDVKNLEVELRFPIQLDQELDIIFTMFTHMCELKVIANKTTYRAAMRIATLSLYTYKDLPKGTAGKMLHRITISHYVPSTFSPEVEEQWVTGKVALPSAGCAFGVCASGSAL